METELNHKRRYFRRFLSYALDYKGLLAISVVMGIAKFTSVFMFPWLLGSAIDHVFAPDPARGFVDTIEARTRWMWLLAGIGVLFSIIHSIATFGRGYYTAKLGNRVIADLRQDLFDHLHRLSLHFYSKERTGSILSRLITDIQQAAQLINGGIVAVAMDSTQLFLGLWLLFGISWKLALTGLAIMPFYIITYKLLNPRVKQASAAVQSQLSKISGNVQERLAGIALVKTYAAEGRERRDFVADTEEHFDRVLQQRNLAQTVSALSEGLVHLGTTAVIFVGGWLTIAGGADKLSAGQITKAIGYLAVMYLPVRRFAEVNVIYQTSLAAIERVFEVFDITPKIVEKPDPVTQPPGRGEVVFENVRFDYADESDESRVSLEEPVAVSDQLRALERAAAKRIGAALAGSGNGRANPPRPVEHNWVLDGINFAAQAGQKIALVGPSGSGKTTLVSLLPRLYDVTAGRILIDGIDVHDYELRALRRAIGIVQQDSFMFSGTVRDNIAYGRPRATDEQVIAAAKAANAHEFIQDLPLGYESRVEERGINLSGGQRQRLSIARAILKDPRILILDEATSALDSESEALVQEALTRLMQDRTAFIIAHRLSTVRHADRILVMQRGAIVETGRHDELVGRNGLYARLVRQQFGLKASEA